MSKASEEPGKSAEQSTVVPLVAESPTKTEPDKSAEKSDKSLEQSRTVAPVIVPVSQVISAVSEPEGGKAANIDFDEELKKWREERKALLNSQDEDKDKEQKIAKLDQEFYKALGGKLPDTKLDKAPYNMDIAKYGAPKDGLEHGRIGDDKNNIHYAKDKDGTIYIDNARNNFSGKVFIDRVDPQGNVIDHDVITFEKGTVKQFHAGERGESQLNKQQRNEYLGRGAPAPIIVADKADDVAKQAANIAGQVATRTVQPDTPTKGVTARAEEGTKTVTDRDVASKIAKQPAARTVQSPVHGARSDRDLASASPTAGQPKTVEDSVKGSKAAMTARKPVQRGKPIGGLTPEIGAAASRPQHEKGQGIS